MKMWGDPPWCYEMTDISPQDLDFVFGPGPGTTTEERARHSQRRYMRSMDQLTEANERAAGRRLTAWEALDAYGWDILLEVAEEGGALLAAGPKAVGRLLSARRKTLGLDARQVANIANIDIRLIESAEAYKRLPIRELEKIARAMGLDERLVSWRSEPETLHHRIGVRLRTIGDEHPRCLSEKSL
jgi:hypothetical protein